MYGNQTVVFIIALFFSILLSVFSPITVSFTTFPHSVPINQSWYNSFIMELWKTPLFVWHYGRSGVSNGILPSILIARAGDGSRSDTCHSLTRRITDAMKLSSLPPPLPRTPGEDVMLSGDGECDKSHSKSRKHLPTNPSFSHLRLSYTAFSRTTLGPDNIWRASVVSASCQTNAIVCVAIHLRPVNVPETCCWCAVALVLFYGLMFPMIVDHSRLMNGDRADLISKSEISS